MATIISHPLVPLVVAVAAGSKAVPWRLLLLGVLFSVLPDIDALAFRLGVPYEDSFGHRGFTHSLLVASVMALACLPLASWLRASRVATGLFLFGAMASHGVLDAFTRQGLGVAFFWPFSDARYFLPFHPVESSPVSISRFLQVRAREVLRSELVWLWLPLVSAGVLGLVARKAWENIRRSSAAGDSWLTENCDSSCRRPRPTRSRHSSTTRCAGAGTRC